MKTEAGPLRLLPRPLATILPPAPDSSACAVSKRLGELAAAMRGLEMGTSHAYPEIAQALASMAERMNRLRAMLESEVPDAG